MLNFKVSNAENCQRKFTVHTHLQHRSHKCQTQTVPSTPMALSKMPKTSTSTNRRPTDGQFLRLRQQPHLPLHHHPTTSQTWMTNFTGALIVSGKRHRRKTSRVRDGVSDDDSSNNKKKTREKVCFRVLIIFMYHFNTIQWNSFENQKKKSSRCSQTSKTSR
jgi:hypothetical protein